MKRLKYIFTVLVALLVFVPSPVYAAPSDDIVWDSNHATEAFCQMFVALTGYQIPYYDSSKPNSSQYDVYRDFYDDCYEYCEGHKPDPSDIQLTNYASSRIAGFNAAKYLVNFVNAKGGVEYLSNGYIQLRDVPDWVVYTLREYAKSKQAELPGSDIYTFTDFNQVQSITGDVIHSASGYRVPYTINNDLGTSKGMFYCSKNFSISETNDYGFITRLYDNPTEFGYAWVVKSGDTVLHFVYAYKFDNHYNSNVYSLISTKPIDLSPITISNVKRSKTYTPTDYSSNICRVQNLFNGGSNDYTTFKYLKLADGYHLFIAFGQRYHNDSLFMFYPWVVSNDALIPAINAPEIINYNYYFNYAGDTQNINNYSNVVQNIDNSVTNNYQQVPDDSISDLLPWVKNIAQNLYTLSDNFNKYQRQLIQTVIYQVDRVIDALRSVYYSVAYNPRDLDVPTDTDISNLKSAIDDFQKVAYKFFPFSVPWDIYTMISFFSAPPEAPKFDVPYINSDYTVGTYHIDLTPFDDAAKTVRAGMRVVFDFGLLLLFKKFSDDTPIG